MEEYFDVKYKNYLIRSVVTTHVQPIKPEIFTLTAFIQFQKVIQSNV